MRAWTTQFISLFIGALGFVSILWLSTAFMGQAKSQEPTNLENAPQAPSMDIPTSGSAGFEETEALVPEIIPGDGFVYDPKGRRDPFRPFGTTAPSPPTPEPVPLEQLPGGPRIPPPLNQAGESPGLSPEQTEVLEPLQTFDISQLKVVGIIWQVNNPKAMIQDPVGKLYLVKKNSKLGRNRGFVAVIREGEVVIVEPAVVEGLNTATTRVLSLIR